MATKNPKKKLNDKITPLVSIFAFCESFIQDKRNRFSLINIFDRVHFSNVPAPFPITIFVSASLPPGTHKISIVVGNPANKKEIGGHQIVIPSDNPVFNYAINDIVIFDHYGKQDFHIKIDGEIISSSFITVTLRD
ncbi:MAG: hypothetical protein K8S20_00565 [Chloroflexi bacterium]|nr:hypothetical protein [Chloroflexota bacterium]